MHDSLLKCAISFKKIANQDVTILPAGTILYHGTIAPFAAQIKQDGFLHGRAWSQKEQGNKTGGGTMDEQGLIWFSPDRTIGADFATGAEVGVDQAKRLGFEDGIVDKGTVFAVKLSRPYKLIDRNAYELSEEDAQKLIPINKAQHYKRIKPGMKASSAVYALFESSHIYDTWKTVLKLLGYDGIVYANVQYALIDDEIPFSSYNDMEMSEEKKKNAIESMKKWQEEKIKRKELAEKLEEESKMRAKLFKERDDKIKAEREERIEQNIITAANKKKKKIASLLYHGTSTKQLRHLIDSGWQARDLYFGDDEANIAAHYAEQQARMDDSDPAIIVADRHRLNESMLNSDYHDDEAQIGQYIYTGPIDQALVAVKINWEEVPLANIQYGLIGEDDEIITKANVNLIYCADLFVKLAGINEVLTTLNVSDEIRQFILSQPKDRMNHCITVLEKNKNIKSVNELKAAVNELLQSADNFDTSAIVFGLGRYAPASAGPREWALDNLRRLRKNNPILNSKKFPEMFPGWYNFIQWLIDSAATVLLGSGGLLPAELQFSRQSFIDWYDNVYDNVGDINRQGANIRSMSVEQVAQAIRDWHEEQAAKGEGGKYQEGTANIVYGPKWHNHAFNGWTVRKVVSKNDLEVEGNKMNHCVGGYCENVTSGSSIIYSLRDPQNEPHATLEGNPEFSYGSNTKKKLTNINFEQIKGHSNSEPKQEYKNMIKEWFQSLMKSGEKITVGEGDNINDRIYEAAQSTRYSKRDFSDNLEKMLSNENDYGIPANNEGYSFDTCYKNMLGVFYNRDNAYYSYMGSAAEPLVRLAIEEDNRIAAKYDDKFKQIIKEYAIEIQKKIKAPLTKEHMETAKKSALFDMGKLWRKNSQIESIVNNTQENSESMFDHVIDSYPPMPDESDFGPDGRAGDEDDYKRALKEYESQVEYIDNNARSYLPYAFDDELMEELNKQLESNPIRLRPWMKESSIWYYSKNKKKKKSA